MCVCVCVYVCVCLCLCFFICGQSKNNGYFILSKLIRKAKIKKLSKN